MNILDRDVFERLVKDALANLFDPAALEINPLVGYQGKGESPLRSRGEQLREALEEAIEQLRPGDDPPRESVPNWRPYLVLHWRYVDGTRLQEIQERLALSERQLRREHSRALHAVTAFLWERFFQDQSKTRPQPWGEGDKDQLNGFPITSELLNLSELINGIVDTIHKRSEQETVSIELLTGTDEIPPVLGDRVILRMVFIRLINSALDASSSSRITISYAVQAGTVQLIIAYPEESQPVLRPIQEIVMKETQYWAQRSGASMEWLANSQGEDTTRLVISLPRADHPVVLIVDDQETAHRMYRRYLSQSTLRLVNLSEGSRVVETARVLQPDVIILDVMIPNIDGWEILQMLHADPQTRHIPVIICSVWDEPELAFSLGAAEFFKKPFSQQDFLGALARFGLV